MSGEEWYRDSASRIAQAVRAGEVSASRLVAESLQRIETVEGRINAFTDVTAERASARAGALDAWIARASEAEKAAMPLLGVPFAVKNLFDVAGLTTRAGSKIEREKPPAALDALLVRRMEAAGAVLVGATNMDEYAYGFTTENSHDGATHNPHDLTRIAGGSSGGSAAAVAAGEVPLALGSDTNGSIRVPASLCGIFGLKPTYGRLPRSGTYPFVASLDHLGPLARSVEDLAAAYDAMQGPDASDPACAQRALEATAPQLDRDVGDLRVAILDGYFADNAGPQARFAVKRVAEFLRDSGCRVSHLELPDTASARAAAFVIGNAEGGALHLPDLRRRAQDFEPLSRDRFLAGALLPAAWVLQAQRFRLRFARQVARLLADVDILLAPATPTSATPIGSEWMEIEGERMATRPGMGLLTQPISCIGLPVCVVPIWEEGPRRSMPRGLPVGVQVIAAPWREDRVLRVARALERAGVAVAPVAALAAR
jgi:amidase/aspartyl-tRNA(Asn)/glutamyl-tRNA(Gln) amidotransferase subunit A